MRRLDLCPSGATTSSAGRKPRRPPFQRLGVLYRTSPSGRRQMTSFGLRRDGDEP